MSDNTNRAIVVIIIIILIVVAILLLSPRRMAYSSAYIQNPVVYRYVPDRTVVRNVGMASVVPQTTSKTTTTRTYRSYEYTPSPTVVTTYHNENTVCPMDARQCPDGSYVGRSGPMCEFSPCGTTYVGD
jgi:hypothetical protein